MTEVIELQKGYYLNDYKDGLTYWEVFKKAANGGFVLELREKPAGQCKDGVTYYRRRLFFEEEIGKTVFETREEAERSSVSI